MAGEFVSGVVQALNKDGKTIVVLGDRDHGGISLNSLASMPSDIIKDTGITTVLVEGYRAHEEPSSGLRAAVDALRGQGITVIGSENDNTLRGLAEFDAAMDDAMTNDDGSALTRLQATFQEVLDGRLRAANMDWATQARDARKKVVICCGTSHLPRHLPQNVPGLIELLGNECAGYAVIEGNYDKELYTPEETNNPGQFGSVKALSSHPGAG